MNTDITSTYLDPKLLRAIQRLIILKNKTITTQPPISHSECSTNDLNQLSDKLPMQIKRTYNGTVEPVKSIDDIQIIKDYFLNQEQRYKNKNINFRNYLLFTVGINCARRIGDILKFTIKDFLKPDGTFKEHFAIKEEKTNKPIKVKINTSIQDALTLYLSHLNDYSPEDYLFQSIEGTNKPLETRSVSRMMKDMSRACGFEARGININTHSMRKTWAYHMYVKYPTEIVKIQQALNHSSQAVTLRYIGIEQEEMDEMFDGQNL